MLMTLNWFLLFQVILVIFVPYFYPEENFGANFSDFSVVRGPYVGHSGTQTKCRVWYLMGHSGTQWDTVGQKTYDLNELKIKMTDIRWTTKSDVSGAENHS